MAPSALGQADCSKNLPAHKLRKPLVEKLRRDRINSSIEQLKALLGQEFLRHQPDSKQEKADILEMAVSYLRGWQQNRGGTSSDGYSRCVQEAVSFLSHCQVQTQAHERLLGHFQDLQAFTPRIVSPPGSPLHRVSSSKGVGQASDAVWRPW